MRRPFEQLMMIVAAIAPDDQVTLGELAARHGEPIERIMDAIDAVKVLAGEPTYLTIPAEHAQQG